MKGFQVTIADDLDAELGIQAAREGVSKEALVARFVAERLRPLSATKQDPLLGDRRDDSGRLAGRLVAH